MKFGKPFEENDHNWVILLEMIQTCYISLPNVKRTWKMSKLKMNTREVWFV